MYYLINGILYLISYLPWFIIYGISDILAMFSYYILGYRKKVIMANLAHAFPEKTLAERKSIARQFYRNFIDTLLESIKMISESDSDFDKRFIPNEEMMELLQRYVLKGSNVQVHAMHNFNWEIVNLGVSKSIHIPFLAVYMPISNKHLEKIFRKIRSRYNTVLVPATEFKKNFIKFEKQYANTPYSLVLVADQNPGSPQHAWWVNFFNKAAPFVKGPEKGARLRSLPVLFGNFYKVKRGTYTFEVELFTENAANLKEGDLTLGYVRYVEKCIRKYPDNYLWSHRRWKHAYKPEYAENVLEKLNL